MAWSCRGQLAAICIAIAVLAASAPRTNAQACFGDCNGNGESTLTELQASVAISLGEEPLATCAPVDGDADAVVTVAELERAVAARVIGCAALPGVPRGAVGGTAVHIGSTAGLPGETVSFDVTLESGGESIAGVQVDIAFSPNTPVAALPNGRPACSVNPAIDKNGTAFAFQPPGCTVGASCTAFRALVLALDNVDPIPDGARMFSCNVAIDPGAPFAVYPLTGSNAGSSDPTGMPISTAVSDGAVTVGAVPTAGPTVTPTSAGAPASLILTRARLRGNVSRREHRPNGWIRLAGVVNANAPFDNLIDDVRTGGLTVEISTTAGARIELPWKPIACIERETARGPRLTCTAEDPLGWREITLRPSRPPNLVELRLVARRLDFTPPLSTEPWDPLESTCRHASLSIL